MPSPPAHLFWIGDALFEVGCLWLSRKRGGKRGVSGCMWVGKEDCVCPRNSGVCTHSLQRRGLKPRARPPPHQETAGPPLDAILPPPPTPSTTTHYQHHTHTTAAWSSFSRIHFACHPSHRRSFVVQGPPSLFPITLQQQQQH